MTDSMKPVYKVSGIVGEAGGILPAIRHVCLAGLRVGNTDTANGFTQNATAATVTWRDSLAWYMTNGHIPSTLALNVGRPGLSIVSISLQPTGNALRVSTSGAAGATNDGGPFMLIPAGGRFDVPVALISSFVIRSDTGNATVRYTINII
jgi:hypothetical protein